MDDMIVSKQYRKERVGCATIGEAFASSNTMNLDRHEVRGWRVPALRKRVHLEDTQPR